MAVLRWACGRVGVLIQWLLGLSPSWAKIALDGDEVDDDDDRDMFCIPPTLWVNADYRHVLFVFMLVLALVLVLVLVLALALLLLLLLLLMLLMLMLMRMPMPIPMPMPMLMLSLLLWQC